MIPPEMSRAGGVFAGEGLDTEYRPAPRVRTPGFSHVFSQVNAEVPHARAAWGGKAAVAGNQAATGNQLAGFAMFMMAWA